MLPLAPANRVLLPIQVVALILLRHRKVLMVTARQRNVFYLPGGKMDGQETPIEALVRESYEELAIVLDTSNIQELFRVEAQAHGEPEGRLVQMRCFGASCWEEPQPANEVNAIHWVTSQDAHRCPPAAVEVLRRLVALDLID